MRTLVRCSLVLVALSAAMASPVRAGIIVDHPPNPINGTAGDTGWYDMFGNFYWQQAADDFQLASPASVSRIGWYGFYGDSFLPEPPPTPPTVAEMMRIRFYDARPSDSLPGLVLYEETFLNPSRTATGRIIITGGTDHPEYRYQADLPTTFELQAGTRYWLEIAQVGITNSLFRWEYSPGAQDSFGSFSLINEHVPDWVRVPGTIANLSFQLIDVPEPSTYLFVVVSVVGVNSIWGRREARRHCIRTSASLVKPGPAISPTLGSSF